MRRYNDRKQKGCFIHRFIWECYNGIITNDRVIDHYNDIRDDNRLSNLQLLITQQENCLKSAKKRDYSFAVRNNQNRKCMKAIDLVTNEIVYYNSLYSVQQHINVNCGIEKMVCEGINNCKSGYPKLMVIIIVLNMSGQKICQ